MPDLPHVLETIAELGAHSWQMQITAAMGRAADEPDVLLQPYDLLTLFPLLGELERRSRELDVRLLPGNNIGYFGPFEAALRGNLPRGCRAGCTWTSFVLFGRAGNNPYCHHRALEMQRNGRRERLVRTGLAPGAFDYGRFELIEEDFT